MKTTLMIVLFSLVGFRVFASNNLLNLSETQIRSLVCHKWKLSYLEFNGVKKTIPQKLPASLLYFMENGIMQEITGDKKEEGKWSYLHDSKTITTDDKDGSEHHKIISITEKELVMDGKYMGKFFNMGFYRMD
mgnify:CR=1 FL=1